MSVRARTGTNAKGVPRVPPPGGTSTELCDGLPEDISDDTPSAGVSEDASRCDHVHAHGARGGGTLHADAVPVDDPTAAGFMSGADKAKLDALFGAELAEQNDGTSGAAKLIDWSAGWNHVLELTANAAITFTAPAPGARLLLRLVQGGVGSFNPASWPASVRWANGNVAPVLTAAPGSQDILSFYYNGTNYFGSLSMPNV